MLGGKFLALLAVLLLTTSLQAQTTAPRAGSIVPPSRTAPDSVNKGNIAPQSTAASAANGWTLVRTINLRQPGAASLDRRGNLYVADGQNNIHQYGPDGQPLNVYSPPLPGHTAQLEAWNVSKIMAFYDDRQEIRLLDRFLAPITQIRLGDYFDGLVRVATLAPDDKLWLLDESDLTLRQFDPTIQRFGQTTPLDLIIGRSKPDFRFLRQYQNNLYLVDRTSGIFVFDNLGNYRKKLPFSGLSALGFRGDELYYLADGVLHFFQLYTLAERRQTLPKVEGGTSQVLVGEGFAYLLTPTAVLVYKL
ncbi:hypothetical protein GCM10011375_03230 [Hymenobacter qilianensis]|uniref:Uncharacterized protein n=1 Tax=Hymenobacter qilianensis TaxID=1385715 RepID=A0ACB5PLP0_9BACT|nr:hypothetical protein GCM10011375_03230 [Hymenobacter qilianensis]